MITAGIDMGSKTIKVVLVEKDKILAQTKVLSGFEQKQSAQEAFDQALKAAGLKREQVQKVVSTGAGRKEAPFFDEDVTEVGADAKGVVFLFPSVRTVIDIGAEEGRGIKCGADGKVVDFAINEKCAAGAGAFTEAMARALEVTLEDFGKISLQSTQAVPMNAQCTVFAESEVVSLIHSKTPKPDIARAVHDAIASRIVSMVRRVGIEKEIALIGGVAHNVGFVEALKRSLETDKVFIPQDPEIVGALGAALLAQS